jgi:RNA polymerase sigma factor (sigma-70 family)
LHFVLPKSGDGSTSSLKSSIKMLTLSGELYMYLLHYAAGKVADKECIEDLIQDTFLIAYEKLDRFEGRSSEKTWLTGILKNIIYESYRRQLARNAVIADTGGLLPSEDGNDDDIKVGRVFTPVVHEVDPERWQGYTRAVHQAIGSLPFVWRTVFVMKYLEGQTVPAICRELNLSRANYWTICHRVKSNIKANMGKQGMNKSSV